MKTRQILLFSAVATLTACKIQIQVPIEGSVGTQSNAISCAAGQTCMVEVDDTFFDETFIAQSAPGWHFSRWKSGYAALCPEDTAPCQFTTTAWAGNSFLEDLLTDPEAIAYLEPEFVVDRTTSGIALAGEQNVTQFGLSFEFDFFRNTAYNCGLSGNYTFMVANPPNGDASTEAPLWVYLHGGGAGYYDDLGIYRAVLGQTENTWNHEETFNDLLIGQLQERVVENGSPKDITLTRRIQDGYRLVLVSMCDHDQYSGLGTSYPNNPNSGAEVNGLQATMAAVEYTVANYPTTQVFAHGTSAGSTGVYNLAMSFAAEDIHLTGVVADSVVNTPRYEPILEAYAGQTGSPFQAGFETDGYVEKLGFYGDVANNAYPEARINSGFDSVPLLFVGGDDDPFCHANFPAIAEALAEGLSNNCDYFYNGLIQEIAGQSNSPHQMALMPGEGHVPTNTVSTANDIVDTFIGDILAGSPDAPFRHIPGLNMMMMGHSFFRPIAEEMDYHAIRAGVDGHIQNVEFSGGASGAPEALWNDTGHRTNIQAVLDTGNVDLFGMTYEPTYPTTLGYELWIDYALSKNPDTQFFIALPWADFPTSYPDAATYSSFWLTSYSTNWLPFIDSLRALYPGVTIYSIPYGQAALELRELHEAGNLPDVSSLQGPIDDAIFTDNKGHAGQILRDLAEFIWIDAIYGIELDKYAYDAGYQTDLKAIAKAIMDAHNPAYNGPNR